MTIHHKQSNQKQGHLLQVGSPGGGHMLGSPADLEKGAGQSWDDGTASPESFRNVSLEGFRASWGMKEKLIENFCTVRVCVYVCQVIGCRRSHNLIAEKEMCICPALWKSVRETERWENWEKRQTQEGSWSMWENLRTFEATRGQHKLSQKVTQTYQQLLKCSEEQGPLSSRTCFLLML